MAFALFHLKTSRNMMTTTTFDNDISLIEAHSPPAESTEQDRLEVRQAYRDLLRVIYKNELELTDEDKKNIRKAFEMAWQAHSPQRRKSGEPFILHPIAVAHICAAEIRLGCTTIVAALLHDVVEDSDIKLEEIREKFGDKVATLVDGLTKHKKSHSTESPQAETFRKILRTLLEDVRVVLIKLADRLHNMRTISSMSRDKQLKIAAETDFIYAPLAHQLGLYAIKTEFQDICMKVREPDVYKSVAKKLAETKISREKYIENFIAPIQKSLNELFKPMRIGVKVFGRAKSISSIANKLKTKSAAFEDIYDLFAIRVVVDVPDLKDEKMACWMAYARVTEIYQPIANRFKDWITQPKLNGYESLHTTVKGAQNRFVEVQIRTERMDDIAEVGFAAHWKYKGIKPQQGAFGQGEWFNNIREILKSNDSSAIDFVNEFKGSLVQEGLYIYTPKGDVIIMPVGSTALDFAFYIHSDIGYHCSGIKIDNVLVSLGHPLKNGDQPTILTNKNQKPNESWLKLVKTSKAKAKIRFALKEEERKIGEMGREILERKLNNWKVPFEESTDTLVKHFRYKTRVDFYMDIYDETFKFSDLKGLKVENSKLVLVEEKAKEERNPVEMGKEILTLRLSQLKITASDNIEEATKIIIRHFGYDNSNRDDFYIDLTNDSINLSGLRSENGKIVISVGALLVDGVPADNYVFTFATCCNPVRGDDIFAYISSKNGMKVHRTTCVNASDIMANYGYRVKKAEWSGVSTTNFVAHLKILGVDSGPGVIQELSHQISTKLGLNIRSFSIQGDEGCFECDVFLMVLNKDQLNLTIKSIQGLKNVSSVARVEN
jgi:GTP diphosphokinase / guanosine-3',5'-bis(diphosphate) 3'-diphosphatase